MILSKNKYLFAGALLATLFIGSTASQAMGLRSMVALPVETGGGVARLIYSRFFDTGVGVLTTATAYGLGPRQTLFLGIPWRLSPEGGNRQGDLSALYRHTVWQDDRSGGTSRFALLGGVVIATDSDRSNAIQAGFVYTYFQGRNEIDIDTVYVAGTGGRLDAGRYDVSWQYRLSPAIRPDWGIPAELNTVLEANGRWLEGGSITHQITAGLQWIHPKLVIEGGLVQDLNNRKETSLVLSTRFHY